MNESLRGKGEETARAGKQRAAGSKQPAAAKRPGRGRRAENRRRVLIGVLALFAICVAGAVFLLTRSKPEPEQTLDFSQLPEEPDAGQPEMVLAGGDGAKSDVLSDAEGSGGILLEIGRAHV